MRLLGLDLETDDVDVLTANITGVGLAIYDTKHNYITQTLSTLVQLPGGKRVSQEIADITKISNSMLNEYGVIPDDSVCGLPAMISDMIQQTDYVVAFNGNNFDRPILERFLEEHEAELPNIPWIDVMTDILYPPDCTYRSLTYVAAFHGFLNPFPHHPLFDVMTALKILNMYDLEEVVERSKSPVIAFSASVSFKDKQLAKDNHFKWSDVGDCKYNGKKTWYIEMKECDYSDKWLDNLPFEVKLM